MEITDKELELECENNALKFHLRELTRWLKVFEDKLKEEMGEAVYNRWSVKAARDMFRAEVESMEDEEFKQLIFEKWDDITKWEDPDNG